MRGEHLRLGIAVHQRVFAQRSERRVSLDGIGSNGCEYMAKCRRSLDENLLWNGVRVQKGAELQQFSRRWILLNEPFKRQGDRCTDRMWMMAAPTSTKIQQDGTLFTIALQVINKATSGFFNIGACLIQCQWKAIHEPGYRSGRCQMGVRRLLQGDIGNKEL